MKYSFLKGMSSHSDEVCLFFTGWGCDLNLFAEVQPATDLILLYDYRTLDDFPIQLLQTYRRVRVVAWSLGVWVAAYTLAGTDCVVEYAVAINGTQRPIDEAYGISPTIYSGTLAGLSERTIDKFRRRMCGSHYTYFMSHQPQRTLEDLRDELTAIQYAYEEHGMTRFTWDCAVVSHADKIFLPSNQHRAWSNECVPVHDIESEHYFPTLLKWAWKNV